MGEINLTLEEIQALLPSRSWDVHKGSLGKVLVVAGSRGMTGAAILASKAVLRSGAGLATLAMPLSQSDLVDVHNVEVMTMPLPETPLGALSKKAITLLVEILPKFDTVLIGPGLSGGRSTAELVRELLAVISEYFPKMRVVLDADGLKALPKIFRPLKMELIITPHFGELAAVLDRTIVEIKYGPEKYARRAAEKYGAIVVLKSHITYVIDPLRRDYFTCSAGNPGMATAGSGDVLAGVIAGTWGSTKISAIKAAVAGVFIHAAAGNYAAQRRSVDGIIASDILEEVPTALRFLKGC